MSTSRNTQVTPLSASHPLTAIAVGLPVANSGDVAGAAFANASLVELSAGSAAAAPAVNGLTVAGIAAVATAVGTYLSGLSAAKKAQLGQARVLITQTALIVPCHSSDVTTFTATMVALLNTGANFGPIGS